MPFTIIVSSFAAFFLLYFYWKKLKDDYTHNLIFTSGLYILFGILSFGIFSVYFIKDWIFWLSLLGSFTGLIIGVFRFKLRFYEVFEAYLLGILSMGLFASLYNYLKSMNSFNLLVVPVAFLLLILFFLIDKNYKKFSWYKSGRVGFSGLFMSGFTFLLIAVISFFFPDRFFFQGKVGSLLAGSLSIISFIMLLRLSKKSV